MDWRGLKLDINVFSLRLYQNVEDFRCECEVEAFYSFNFKKLFNKAMKSIDIFKKYLKKEIHNKFLKGTLICNLTPKKNI